MSSLANVHVQVHLQHLLLLLLVLLIFSSSCSYSTSTLQLRRQYVSLELNTTFNAAEGRILLTNNGLGCGFSSVVCSYQRKCFVLSVSFLGPDGGFKADRVVWAANGNKPLLPDSKLHLSIRGELLLLDPKGNVAWSSNTSGMGATKLKLKNSGNLVLVTPNDTEVWRSFDSPTDTLMPGQGLLQSMKLQSCKSSVDLGAGAFSLVVTNRSVTVYVTSTSINSGPVDVTPYATWLLNERVTSNISQLVLVRNGTLRLLSANGTTIGRSQLKLVQEKYTDKKLLFLRLGHDGSLKLFFEGVDEGVALTTRLPGSRFKVATRGFCSLPNRCDRGGICNQPRGNCSCPGSNFYRPVGRGCQPLRPLVACNGGNNSSRVHHLLELSGTDYFSTHFTAGLPVSSKEECGQRCLQNCSCEVAIFKQVVLRGRNTTELLCYQLRNVLTLINVTGATNFTSVALMKVEEQQRRRRAPSVTLWLAVSLALFTILLLPVAVLCLNKLRRKHKSDELLESIPGVPRRFTFAELREATGNFSRKLGSGGFGTVYQGTLEDGTKVAVKRLECSKAAAGEHQFKAEVIAIGSVHHSNLVRLIGFCCDELYVKHTLLVYEYLPNGSLDKWIFDEPEKFLTWRSRFKVAVDIAKGLAYLHEGCERSVLHLDIKPQNILLDVEFKAKISDFGLAMFATKDLVGNRHTDVEKAGRVMIRGTPGYMAPEWLHSQVSTKIDVYSFGIVVLEIASGMQALRFLDTMSMHLKLDHNSPVHAGDDNMRGWLMELVDPRVREEVVNCGGTDMDPERLVLVALCCIQDDPASRPGMGDVVKMLEHNLDVPDALLNLRYQSTALPLGIASFLAAAKSRSMS